MTLADKITMFRVVLAPVFYGVYALPLSLPGVFASSGPSGAAWTVPVLWLIFIAAEISDMIDGQVARRLNQGSDFGKLFDPFADTLTQLTYFLCFVLEGIFPAGLFLLVIYREFGILFVRNLMLRKGVVMGARISGKIKTFTYIVAGALALLALSLKRLGLPGLLPFLPFTRIAALAVFGVSIIFSLYSFMDYLRVYRNVG